MATTRSIVHTLRSLPSFRPGIAYVLDTTLHLAPTVLSPIATNYLRSCRVPHVGQAESTGISSAPTLHLCPSQSSTVDTDLGFEPLRDGSEDPTANELASLVDQFYAARTPIESLGSMGENDCGVVFQGEGDPMAAADVVVDTVRSVAELRNGIAFRLNTFGLCDAADVDLLLNSSVLAHGDSDQRRETRIATVGVFLPAANPLQYAEIIQPDHGLGFGDACSFVARLAEAGVSVECMTVARPDVNVGEVKALALSLGATRFLTQGNSV